MSANVQGTLPAGVQLLPNWQDIAADTYAKKLSVAAACREAGISRQTWYNYMDRDPMFAAKIAEAKADATDNLKESAYVRAKDGTKQTRTFYDPKSGAVTSVAETTQHETNLTIRMLEALDPETFTPRSRNELSGPGGTPIQVDVTVRNEQYRVQLTQAVQNYIDAGLGGLREALTYLAVRGVPKDHLALIRGEDLVIETTAIEAGSNGSGHYNDASSETSSNGDGR